jgi:Co/Zn/Cd efflux system component
MVSILVDIMVCMSFHALANLADSLDFLLDFLCLCFLLLLDLPESLESEGEDESEDSDKEEEDLDV